MRDRFLIYFVWIFVITNLFYDERWGLNALLVAVFTISLMAWRDKRLPGSAAENSAQWWMAAGTWLIAAVGLFLNGTPLAGIIYFFTFQYFVAVQQRWKVSVPVAYFQAAQSCFFGIGYFFIRLVSPGESPQPGNHKWIRQALLFIIPLTILIIFLKLYQLADPKFYELTQFINLDWISWGFVIVYGVLVVMFYGSYHYRPLDIAKEFDQSLKNEVSPSYVDRIQNFFGIANEQKLAVSLLCLLNLMLLIYLVIDFKFLISSDTIARPDSYYSVNVHSGINALIFSIVLVMLMVTVLFRGGLNFENGRMARVMAASWIVLNCVVVVTTALKNYEYVAHLGLTHKRLGVYFYLLLCLVGLVLTFYKIIRVRSIWFMVRGMSITFLIFISLLSVFNWNQLITRYNISHVSPERLDVYYLLSLGPDSYPDLADHLAKNEFDNTDFLYELYEKSSLALNEWQLNQLHYSWRSYNYSDAVIFERLSVSVPLMEKVVNNNLKPLTN